MTKTVSLALIAVTSIAYTGPEKQQSEHLTEGHNSSLTELVGFELEREDTSNLTIQSNSITAEEDGVKTVLQTNLDKSSIIEIDNSISVGISIADPSFTDPAVISEDGTAVFSSEKSDKSYELSILDGGSIAASSTIYSPSSNKNITYNLSENIKPVVQETGAVALYEDSFLIGIIEHPEAADATGSAIASTYSISEGNIVQNIKAEKSATYPIATNAKVVAFITRGDKVHVTRGEASGHGWWVKGTTKAVKAKVTVQLQYKPKKDSRWKDRGTAGVRTIKPGTSKRANSRIACKSDGKKQWRSWVDVDLIGYLDTPNKVYTAEQTLKCTI